MTVMRLNQQLKDLGEASKSTRKQTSMIGYVARSALITSAYCFCSIISVVTSAMSMPDMAVVCGNVFVTPLPGSLPGLLVAAKFVSDKVKKYAK